jgi:hypothetical protein
VRAIFNSTVCTLTESRRGEGLRGLLALKQEALRRRAYDAEAPRGGGWGVGVPLLANRSRRRGHARVPASQPICRFPHSFTATAVILTSTRKRSYSQKRNTVSKFSAFGRSPVFDPVETSQGHTFERAVNQRCIVVYGHAMQVHP